MNEGSGGTIRMGSGGSVPASGASDLSYRTALLDLFAGLGVAMPTVLVALITEYTNGAKRLYIHSSGATDQLLVFNLFSGHWDPPLVLSSAAAWSAAAADASNVSGGAPPFRRPRLIGIPASAHTNTHNPNAAPAAAATTNGATPTTPARANNNSTGTGNANATSTKTPVRAPLTGPGSSHSAGYLLSLGPSAFDIFTPPAQQRSGGSTGASKSAVGGWSRHEFGQATITYPAPDAGESEVDCMARPCTDFAVCRFRNRVFVVGGLLPPKNGGGAWGMSQCFRVDTHQWIPLPAVPFPIVEHSTVAVFLPPLPRAPRALPVVPRVYNTFSEPTPRQKSKAEAARKISADTKSSAVSAATPSVTPAADTKSSVATPAAAADNKSDVKSPAKPQVPAAATTTATATAIAASAPATVTRSSTLKSSTAPKGLGSVRLYTFGGRTGFPERRACCRLTLSGTGSVVVLTTITTTTTVAAGAQPIASAGADQPAAAAAPETKENANQRVSGWFRVGDTPMDCNRSACCVAPGPPPAMNPPQSAGGSAGIGPYIIVSCGYSVHRLDVRSGRWCALPNHLVSRRSHVLYAAGRTLYAIGNENAAESWIEALDLSNERVAGDDDMDDSEPQAPQPARGSGTGDLGDYKQRASALLALASASLSATPLSLAAASQPLPPGGLAPAQRKRRPPFHWVRVNPSSAGAPATIGPVAGISAVL